VEKVFYSVLAIPLRRAMAMVFWNSAMVKRYGWNAAVTLSTDEYIVPILPPRVAAYIAICIELTSPVLLVLGLMSGSMP